MKLFLLPILLLAFSCSHSPESTPKKVANTFVIRVLNDLAAKELKNLSKESRDQLEKAAGQWQEKGLKIEAADLLVSVPQPNEDWLGNLNTNIVDSTNKKIVEITSDYNKNKKLKLHLVKENGKWKIDLF